MGRRGQGPSQPQSRKGDEETARFVRILQQEESEESIADADSTEFMGDLYRQHSRQQSLDGG